MPYSSLIWLKWKGVTITNAEKVGKIGTLCITSDNIYWYNHFEKLFGSTRGVHPFGVSGQTGRRRVVLGHTLNTQTLTKTDEQKKVLSKFMILCRAIFIAILGHMQWVGHPCEQNIYMTHDPTIPRPTDMSTYCFQKAHISIVILASFKKAKQLNS